MPAIVLSLCVLWLLSGLRIPSTGQPIDLARFGQLPILEGGRVKPLDTLARTTLLMLRGKQTVRVEDQSVPAIAWLADMLYRPGDADGVRVFEIDDPDVLGMMGIQQTLNRDYSFQDLRPSLQAVQAQAAQADKLKPEQRSRYQDAVLNLQNKLDLYQRLQNTLQIAGTDHVASEYQLFEENTSAILSDHLRMVASRDPRVKRLSEKMMHYQFMNEAAAFYPLPGPRGLNKMDWVSIGQGLKDALVAPGLHPGILAYAAMGDAYRAQDPQAFNAALASYEQWLQSRVRGNVERARAETLFNSFEPFYKSMVLYVLVFLLVTISWLAWPRLLNQTAFWLLGLAFVVHTGGLFARMILQGRPPVTNLYSSAIFVGWAAVLLGIVMERIYRNGLGSLVASAIGFLTLIIAHHLTSQGDTMEMMRAVLDSNFWLATHVVCITIGYSSTFLSGFLGALYLVRRIVDRRWNEASAAELERMVYGIVCFSTFFSFLGTILGGIWADQSWGRFWGWDPKENGALMIVLWNVLILHARWGGFAKPRAIMMLAVFGNIVTALSWFGVNMLGIGLHSYGFMEKAFVWLVVFAISQAFILLLGLVPSANTPMADARQQPSGGRTKN